MSLIKCQKCGGIIDSDDDPDCFVELTNMRRLHREVVWCEPCRDEYFEAQEEAAGAGP